MASLSYVRENQLVLRASDAAVAFTAAKGSRGAAAAVRAKMPEEVEKEAKARVVSHCTEWVNDKYIFH